MPVQPLTVSPPLKILAAGSSPRGVPHLDEETELLKLETALEKDRRIEVIPLPPEGPTDQVLLGSVARVGKAGLEIAVICIVEL